jgi:hypothetical protein
MPLVILQYLYSLQIKGDSNKKHFKDISGLKKNVETILSDSNEADLEVNIQNSKSQYTEHKPVI